MKRTSFTLGGAGYESIVSVADTSIISHVQAQSHPNNIPTACPEIPVLFSEKPIKAFLNNRQSPIPQKAARAEIRKVLNERGLSKGNYPLKTQDNRWLGGLFLLLILVGFFYLAFLLLTRIGWISTPFWKALLVFIAFLLFLYLFTTGL